MDNNKRTVLIGGGLILLLVVGLMIFIQKKNAATLFSQKPISTDLNRFQPTATPTLIPHPILGSMTIQSKSGLKRLSKGNTFSVVILANSAGKNVVGYDAILSYDKSAFTYVKAVSLLPEFTIYSFERPTYISMSAIKSLQNKSISQWNNTQLVEVVFQPKKTGSFSFLLSPSGKEVSKLVDEKASVVYPKTDKLELEIF